MLAHWRAAFQMCADAHCIWKLKPHGDASGSGVLSYRSFPLDSRHWRSLSPTLMQTCRLALARSVMVSAWSIWGLPGAAPREKPMGWLNPAAAHMTKSICLDWYWSRLIGETSDQDASRHRRTKDRIGLGCSRSRWITKNSVCGRVLELPERRNEWPRRFQESLDRKK